MATSDWIAITACLVSVGALIVSLLALAQNRNSLSVYVGSNQMGPFLEVTNNSPHAVTLSDFGIVKPDGSSSSLKVDTSTRFRIDPRDTCEVQIGEDLAADIRAIKGDSPRWGCYVRLATGHRFNSISRVTIVTWWVVGWFDGSREDLRKRSEL